MSKPPGLGLRIADLIDLLGAEAGTKQAGESIVLDKLAEVLFAMVLRAHMESSGGKRGFLAALVDSRLGRALGAMHREPDRNWQVGLAHIWPDVKSRIFLPVASQT